jgi:hypothetical protein
MVGNNSRGTATSAIWKTIIREWRTTFAPSLIRFSHGVVNVQWRTALGSTACRRKLPENRTRDACASRNPSLRPFPEFGFKAVAIGKSSRRLFGVAYLPG